MTSLAEVYEGLGEEATRRQLYAGTGLFAVGALVVVAGIVVATTGVLSPLGLHGWESWEPAGILAGLGLPAVFVGIFTVLPASREVRAAAVIGASVAVLGVTLFAYAYPTRWSGNTPDLTLLVSLVYFLGAITTFWCLFTAVANFEPRNDPGGTVRLEVTRGGETRVVEVDSEDLDGAIDESAVLAGSDVTGGRGGSAGASAPGAGNRGAGASADSASGSDGGFFDGISDDEAPDGSSITERTAGAVRSATDAISDATGGFSGSGNTSGGSRGGRTDGSRETPSGVGGSSPKPASDGGATEPGIRTPADDAEVMSARPDPADTTDRYCGNCQHFQYVQTSRGMRPFCELDDGIMDDMDACDRWEPNQMD